MSSKPTTETSSGIFSLASPSARVAPIAEISLNANSAVNVGRFREFAGHFVAEFGDDDSPTNCPVRPRSISSPNFFADPRTAFHRTSVSELNSCPLMKAICEWPKLGQMFERQFCRTRVIQNDIRHAGNFLMPGNRHQRRDSIFHAHAVSTAINPSTARSWSKRGYSSISSLRWRWLTTNKNILHAADDLRCQTAPARHILH